MENQTIAQQLKVTEFPFTIKNSKGNRIYCEYSDGFWLKIKYDSNGNKIHYEDSKGYWIKYEYDSNGNAIYCENVNGYVSGYIQDNGPIPVELTMDEIASKFGIDVNLLKIKK